MIEDIKEDIIFIIDNINNIYKNICITTPMDVNRIINMTHNQSLNEKEQLIKIMDNTISGLINNGVNDLPIMERIGHVRENILTEYEAKRLKYSIYKKHYHGLGKICFLKIVDSLCEPNSIYQYNNNGKYDTNNFIVITNVKRKDENAIIPIEINNKGQYNNKEVFYNRIKTVYFKNTTKYLKRLKNEGKIKEIFVGSNSQKTSLDDTNITHISGQVKQISDELLLLLTII